MAEKLGIPVGEMLLRMDSAEITEWMAYYEIMREGSAPVVDAPTDPEELSKRLKAALFKKAN